MKLELAARTAIDKKGGLGDRAEDEFFRANALTTNRVAEEGLVAVCGSLVCTILTVAIFWTHVNSAILVSWALVSQVINFGGYVLLLRLRQEPPTRNRFRIGLIVYSVANGLVWGIAGFAFLYSAMLVDNLIFVGIIILMATCWQWGLLSSWSSLAIFDVLVFGSLTLRLLTFSDVGFGHNGLAALSVIAGWSLFLLAYGSGRHLFGMEVLALQDPLTGLPNRALFQDRLELATAVSDRAKVLTAVLLLDLDHFKHINDGLGHDVGDKLLQQVSQRLSTCIRAFDTVARLGGDEFVVIQTSITEPGQAVVLAERIAGTLGQPFEVEGQNIYTGATVGITLYPSDARNIGQILKNADLALYRAKSHERGTFEFYSEELGSEAAQRMRLGDGLRQALAKEELYFVYQPKFETRSGRVVGVEALLRWQSPVHGAVPPGVFIPVAESTGLILSVGEWVLTAACRQLHEWHEAGFPLVPLSINLSGAQFRNASLLEEVRDRILSAGVDPAMLELEVTETTLMHDAATATVVLRELSKIGVQLSIDDFGTGYSSLNYLKQFPVGKLKIDKSFVDDIGVNEKDTAIARAVTELGHSLGLTVLAEGVEKEAQLENLREIGSDEVQGYLLSRPLDRDRFETFLTERVGSA
jgi:diguanylate cyclase (GGDEF)-like protein